MKQWFVENEADVKQKMELERIRYCSQAVDITSSDYEAVHSAEREQLRKEIVS